MKKDDRITSDEEDIIHIQRVLNGEKDEFDYIIKKYQKIIYSLTAMHIKKHEECIEITQEIFIKLYLRLSKFDLSRRFFFMDVYSGPKLFKKL